MDADSEIAALKERVAKLEAQLELHSHYLQVRAPDLKAGQVGGLSIRCSWLGIADPKAPRRMQAIVGATPEGARLEFYNEEGVETIGFYNEHGLPRISLGPPNESGMDLAIEEGGEASVTFKFKGKPRVGLAAEEDIGRILTLFDDEQGRAILVGTAEGGQLVLTNSDLKPSVLLRGDAPGGGGITVGDVAGKPALIMGSMAGSGLLTA